MTDLLYNAPSILFLCISTSFSGEIAGSMNVVINVIILLTVIAATTGNKCYNDKNSFLFKSEVPWNKEIETCGNDPNNFSCVLHFDFGNA